MSVNAVMALTLLPGVRNWNTGVSRRDIEVFDPQAGQSLHFLGVILGRYMIIQGVSGSSDIRIEWFTC